MFFNAFLSLFDNKGSYKILPCKFFCRFFYPHVIISRKTNEKNYTIDNIIFRQSPCRPQNKKRGLATSFNIYGKSP